MLSRKFLVLLSFVFQLVSCGEQDQNVVNKFSYNINQNELDLFIEFNQDVELDLELALPVKDYGFVEFSPSERERGFSLGFDLNLDILLDDEIMSIEKTRNLPNGRPMSTYVTEDLARYKINISKKISNSLYLGFDPDNLFFGNAIELDFINDDFPSGLSITQRFRDNKNRLLGIITLYGPNVEENEVIAPGGVFVMMNISDLASYLKEDQIIVYDIKEEKDKLQAINIKKK